MLSSSNVRTDLNENTQMVFDAELVAVGGKPHKLLNYQRNSLCCESIVSKTIFFLYPQKINLAGKEAK